MFNRSISFLVSSSSLLRIDQPKVDGCTLVSMFVPRRCQIRDLLSESIEIFTVVNIKALVFIDGSISEELVFPHYDKESRIEEGSMHEEELVGSQQQRVKESSLKDIAPTRKAGREIASGEYFDAGIEVLSQLSLEEH